MLDKLALEMEKSKLMDENVTLRTALGHYLDGITLSEKAKAKYNALMVHNLHSFSNMCVFLLVLIKSNLQLIYFWMCSNVQMW